MRWIAASFSAASLLLLSACAGSAPPITHVCPAIIPYTPAQQREIEAEMRQMPKDWIMRQVIADDFATRQAIRNCQG